MAKHEKYVVYSKENCTYCQQAKNMLLLKGKEFVVYMLGVDYTLEHFQEYFPEQKTFPMIVKETREFIGGFDKLKEVL